LKVAQKLENFNLGGIIKRCIQEPTHFPQSIADADADQRFP
jgi:hypothetical protein